MPISLVRRCRREGGEPEQAEAGDDHREEGESGEDRAAGAVALVELRDQILGEGRFERRVGKEAAPDVVQTLHHRARIGRAVADDHQPGARRIVHEHQGLDLVAGGADARILDHADDMGGHHVAAVDAGAHLLADRRRRLAEAEHPGRAAVDDDVEPARRQAGIDGTVVRIAGQEVVGEAVAEQPAGEPLACPWPRRNRHRRRRRRR